MNLNKLTENHLLLNNKLLNNTKNLNNFEITENKKNPTIKIKDTFNTNNLSIVNNLNQEKLNIQEKLSECINNKKIYIAAGSILGSLLIGSFALLNPTASILAKIAHLLFGLSIGAAIGESVAIHTCINKNFNYE